MQNHNRYKTTHLRSFGRKVQHLTPSLCFCAFMLLCFLCFCIFMFYVSMFLCFYDSMFLLVYVSVCLCFYYVNIFELTQPLIWVTKFALFWILIVKIMIIYTGSYSLQCQGQLSSACCNIGHYILTMYSVFCSSTLWGCSGTDFI